MTAMASIGPGEITRLLQGWRSGDKAAETKLFQFVEPDLYKLAACYMRRERPGHTLQATALLNEAYLKLARAREVNWLDRRHFFAFAARAMRRFLVDYQRGRDEQVPLPDEMIAQMGIDDTDRLNLAVSVEMLLDELGKQNSHQSAVVELKFFLGMTDSEVAEALHLPLRTVQRRWLEARAWLFERLEAQGWKKQGWNRRHKTTSAS